MEEWTTRTSVVTHFRELRIYQAAFECSMRIFELSKDWPREERYALTDQIRRASRSVCASIAEAWGKRRYTAHFISKLTDADSELHEVQVWLDFALKCSYLGPEEHAQLNSRYRMISGGLVKMQSEPEKWCGPANRLREETPEYCIES